MSVILIACTSTEECLKKCSELKAASDDSYATVSAIMSSDNAAESKKRIALLRDAVRKSLSEASRLFEFAASAAQTKRLEDFRYFEDLAEARIRFCKSRLSVIDQEMADEKPMFESVLINRYSSIKQISSS